MVVKQINSLLDVNVTCWNRLVQNKDPFLRHEFLVALEQSGSVSTETGWLANHLLIFEQQDLIAAMPLYLKNHSWGEYVFDQQWADAYYQSGMEYYPKWVNAIPFTPCQGQRLLIKQGMDETKIISLFLETIKQISEQNNISSFHCLFPDQSQTEYLRPHLLMRVGVQFQWLNQNYRDYKDFLQTFASRHRKKINKERRKVNQQGIILQRYTGLEISEQQWQVFYQFYELTYLKRGQSAYLNLEFFKQLAETIPEQLLLVLAIKDAKYVGAALSFIGETTLYGRYWGCYEEFNNLHFETCYYQGLEFCLEHGLQRFDSGAQGEHKISRGFEPVYTYSGHWIQNSQFSSLIAEFLDREKIYMQQYKKQCSEQLPFSEGKSIEQACASILNAKKQNS